MPAQGERRKRWIRLAAYAAVGGQLWFVASWLFAGAQDARYSHLDSFVSELGGRTAANPWIVNAAIAVLGASIALLGGAVVGALAGRRSGWVAGLAFVAAGACFIGAAVFPVDCATSVDSLCRARERAGQLSSSHYAHVWLAFGVQLALSLTPFALAWALRPGWLSKLLAVGGALGIANGVVSFMLEVSRTLPVGLVQRFDLFVVHSWVAANALALLIWATEEPDGWIPVGSSEAGLSGGARQDRGG